MLAARLTAKLSRDFQTADAIRDELRDLGVVMHDGTKLWRGDGVDAFQSNNGGRGGGGGGGRTFSAAARGSGEGLRQDGSQDPSGYVYTRAGLQPADGGVELDEVKVHELIDVRGQYKMTGRFAEADAVRDELLAMGVSSCGFPSLEWWLLLLLFILLCSRQVYVCAQFGSHLLNLWAYASVFAQAIFTHFPLRVRCCVTLSRWSSTTALASGWRCSRGATPTRPSEAR